MSSSADASSLGPRTEALVAAAQRLWPSDATVRVGRREAVPPGRGWREFVLVPNARRPRLLVPAHHPAAAASSVQRYSSALRLPERIVRAGLAPVLRSGVLDRLPLDRLVVSWPATTSDESVEEPLAEVFGQEVTVALGVGPARANGKPVLAVFGRAGESIGFVKVGDNPVTTGLVQREAAALDALSNQRFRHLRVPRLLACTTWRDLELLCMTALPTRSRRGTGRSWVPVDAMRELAGAGAVAEAPLRSTAFWQRLQRDVARVDDEAQRQRFAGALARLDAEVGGGPVVLGAWHGDWTPWNMSFTNGAVSLWDWERYDPAVPSGFDLLHYRWQVEAGRRGVAAGIAALRSSGRDWLHGAWSLPRHADAGVTVGAYLAEVTGRYLLAAQEAVGGPLRARADAVLTAFDAHAAPRDRTDRTPRQRPPARVG